MSGADFEGLEQSVRGLEEDAGLAAGGGGEEVALAAAALHGQEAAVVKAFGRKAAADERGEHGAGAGHNGVGEPAFLAGAEQAVAGVADAGQARVGDDRDVFSGGELFDQLRGAARFIVLMITDERLADLEVPQQMAEVSRVFAGDQIDAFQDF